MATTSIPQGFIVSTHSYINYKPLTCFSFCRKYILIPMSDELSCGNKVIALITSIALGIITGGLCHLFIRLFAYNPDCDKPSVRVHTHRNTHAPAAVQQTSESIHSSSPKGQAAVSTAAQAVLATTQTPSNLPSVASQNANPGPTTAMSLSLGTLPLPLNAVIPANGRLHESPLIQLRKDYVHQFILARISAIAPFWELGTFEPLVVVAAFADISGQSIGQNAAVIQNLSQLLLFERSLVRALFYISENAGKVRSGGVEVLVCRRNTANTIDYSRGIDLNVKGRVKINAGGAPTNISRFQPTVRLITIDDTIKNLVTSLSPGVTF